LTSSTNIRELTKILVPKYKVTVHRDVNSFIAGIAEPERKKLAQELLNDLPDYPDVLHRWDMEKVRGTNNQYRVRIGRYRIGFIVDKKNRAIEVPEAFLKK
jgi:mRNA-degrading endonuclease RelE of RelBE toxin-antitoxin system